MKSKKEIHERIEQIQEKHKKIYGQRCTECGADKDRTLHQTTEYFDLIQELKWVLDEV